MALGAKVSIVMPVYNDEAFVAGALESALGQTLADIELVCVDDGSDDASLDILRAAAARDPRVRVIEHGRNLGSSQARKNGVVATTGAYVMFLDADDELAPEACERALAAIEGQQVDMVHFGLEVVNCANLPQARIDSNQRLIAPDLERIECDGPDGLVPACWAEGRFRPTLWNKIYRGTLCRAAFAELEDGRFARAQDLYAFFVLAWHARSYAGVVDVLYRYHFGRGVTGVSDMALASFEGLLTEHEVVRALRRFAAERGADGRLAEVLNGIERGFLRECVSKWQTDLAPMYRSAGFDALAATWGYEAVVCELARTSWWNQAQLARGLIGAGCLARAPRSATGPLTVAYHYRCIANGGAQRVAAELCNRWARLVDEAGAPRYRVVLVCDGGPDKSEYPLDAAVERAYLPPLEDARQEAFAARFAAWQRIVDGYAVDVVVMGRWMDDSTLFDLLAVKGHARRPGFVLHAHSFSARPYQTLGDTALRLTYLYQLCDAAVVLSECDRTFVGGYCGRVRYIPNPVDYALEQADAAAGAAGVSEGPDTGGVEAREPLSVVWVGRISSEKQPIDLVRMMAAVVRRVPGARLHLVGSGDEELERAVAAEVARLGLEEFVAMEGFTLDVGAWYRRASVAVCTSDFEGFPMTVAEELAHALPVAMYELPWLTFLRDGRGIQTVPQGRYDLLADCVAELLEDPERARALGRAGREQLEELAAVDVGALWGELFDELRAADDRFAGRTPVEPHAGESDEWILLRSMSRWGEQGKLKQRDLRRKAERELRGATKRLGQTEGQLRDARGELREERERAKDELSEMRGQLAESRTQLAKSKAQLAAAEGQLKEARARVRVLSRPSGLGALATARLDVKNAGGAGAALELVEISDPAAVVSAPAWLCTDGAGFQIQSEEGSLEFRLRCVGAGELQLALRGVDRRNADGDRVPIWVDYTAASVNGKELLEAPRAVWHNAPVKHAVPVADGDEVVVRAAWRLHAQGELEQTEAELEQSRTALARTKRRLRAERRAHGETQGEVERLAAELEEARAQVGRLRARNKRLAAKNKQLEGRLERSRAALARLRGSWSWKIGRAITWLPRQLRRLLQNRG